MTEYSRAIQTLIEELESLVDDRERSPLDENFLPLGPIEVDYPELYKAIQLVESFTGGKLPMGAWEHSNELLQLSRESGGDPRRTRRACIEAQSLLAWARAQFSAMAAAKCGSFLDIEIEFPNLTIRRAGKSAEFGNKTRAWSLFCHVYAAGETGRYKSDLFRDVRPRGDVQENNLDQHKSVVNDLIEELGIEIRADSRGNWRLVELRLPRHA